MAIYASVNKAYTAKIYKVLSNSQGKPVNGKTIFFINGIRIKKYLVKMQGFHLIISSLH